MRPLKWSRNRQGNLNGKAGWITLFTVSYHSGQRNYIAVSKLPGIRKAITAKSEREAQEMAEKLYQEYLGYLNKHPWAEAFRGLPQA
jgi:hypothetical protein